MGYIPEANVEWAMVNRLKAVLEAPEPTDFNVTRAFSAFCTILLWTKQRAWVGGNNPQLLDPADLAANAVRRDLAAGSITDLPWSLSQIVPARMESLDGRWREGMAVNEAFFARPADAFFRWVRDVIAHGDGRKIRPISKIGRDGKVAYIGGVTLRSRADFLEPTQPQRELNLDLFKDDMVRLGSELADRFCVSMSQDPGYIHLDIATQSVRELGGDK